MGCYPSKFVIRRKQASVSSGEPTAVMPLGQVVEEDEVQAMNGGSVVNGTSPILAGVQRRSISYRAITGSDRGPRRPVRIVLIRHGQSMGNVDEAAYTHTPDWKIPLTEKGIEQAKEAGRKLAKMRAADAVQGPVFLYSSPYKRCQQTAEAVLQGAGVGADQITGHIEEPRIREQDFGNFQDVEKMQECKAQRAQFGRFFYRFPNGESGADVYDRVSTWLESLFREMEYGGINENTTVLLVTHGLTARLFLMRWYHWSVHVFEETYNPSNAQVLVMERENYMGGAYFNLTDDSRTAIGLPDAALKHEETERRRQLQITKQMNSASSNGGPLSSANSLIKVTEDDELTLTDA